MDEDHNDVFGLVRRRFERSSVRIPARIRIAGDNRHQVQIIDLSRAGFQMECIISVPADRLIYMTIPGFASIEASVAWHSGWHYGCVFSLPLHEAIYDDLVKKYPEFSAN